MITVIPKMLGWAAPRLRCNLRFHKFFPLPTALSNTVGNVRFEPTYLYDVDPVVGSTALPGFAEYGALYRQYRVNSASIDLRLANNDTQNILVYCCPVNSDPGANYNSAAAQQYLGSRLSKRQILGPLSGQNQGHLSDYQTVAGFGGAANRQIADFYTGLTSGVAPQNNFFWTVGIVCSSTSSTGVTVDMTLDVEVEFFELASPSA